jgi:hypothetical protein
LFERAIHVFGDSAAADHTLDEAAHNRGDTMQIRPSLTLIATIAVAGAAVAGCTSASRTEGACPSAPALVEETMPKPPVSEQQLIWQPGHWDWNGNTYAWTSGDWLPKPPSGSGMWLEGHWTREGKSAPCVWVPAGWV